MQKTAVFDVVVVGLGAMGSASVYQLAKTGARVLGIDQFTPPHTLGSTHGDTRITRVATGEGDEYVPLSMRANHIWKELSEQSGVSLFEQIGCLVVGSPGVKGSHGVNDFLEQTMLSAQQYNVAYERLSNPQLRQRFGQFTYPLDKEGCYELGAGYLRPEACVELQLALAQKLGAQLQYGERFVGYTQSRGEVTVNTTQGNYRAKKLVLAAGPWLGALLGVSYADLFQPYRQVLYWFDLKGQDWYDYYRDIPVFIWEPEMGCDDFIYGFPPIDGPQGGMKVAFENYRHKVTMDTLSRNITAKERLIMHRKYIAHKLPGLKPDCVRAATCLFTVTPDHRFLIDFHPQQEQVLIVSPCSGHGFKHSAAIGEVVAQLATIGKSDIEVGDFGFQRLLRN